MRNFVTACMLCLMCVAHTACGGQLEDRPTAVVHPEYRSYDAYGKGHEHIKRRLEHRQKKLDQIRSRNYDVTSQELPNRYLDLESDLTKYDSGEEYHRRMKRHTHDESVTDKILDLYGDGGSINATGLNNMLKYLGLIDTNKTEITPELNYKCISSEDLITTINKQKKHTHSHGHSHDEHKHADEQSLDGDAFKELCPTLLYTKISNKACVSDIDVGDVSHKRAGRSEDRFKVWLYSTLSIIVISACGLLGVAVVPIMQSAYYNYMIQYLVALAVGTLCGDALLHLLPHAMMGGHDEEAEPPTHDEAMWMGLAAMMGVVFFYFTEKGLTVLAEMRKRRQKASAEGKPRRVRVISEEKPLNATSSSIGKIFNFNKEKGDKKQCKHKYSEYPYCYDEIQAETRDNHHHAHANNTSAVSIVSSKALQVDKEEQPTSKDWLLDEAGKATLETNGAGDSYTVILREHSRAHHGHSHSHGHVHAPPDSISSAAWMLIMGDGLHNFTDGMAIGAAFSSNIAGGLSTAVAVLCHELPHELGDFAVLIKAGMSVRRALAYNALSSLVCVLGMCVGIFAADTSNASRWLFALAAGTFLYIALVDMMPELSSGHSKEGSAWMCVAQATGLATGVGVMLIIAYYEHDLLRLFS